MNQETGVAVVVTYNRKDKLFKCIECLLKQTYPLDKIYIINNASTDGTESLLNSLVLSNSKIEYRTMNENLGGSGGFQYGIKWAYAEGADWIWGMDDDAFPEKEALNNLLDERSKNQEICAYWSNPNCDISFDGNTKLVQEWMFVGFFIPREIVKAIGYPRGDYFIYYDDLEYADRIIRHGFPIYKVRNSVIHHQDAVSELRKLKIGNKTINIVMLPSQNWKVYYLARNDLLRFSRDDARLIESYKRNIRRIIKVLRYNPKQLGVLLKGIWHGTIGKSGKIMTP